MTTQCYDIDGSPHELGKYIPCNQTAVGSGGHKSCCAPGDNCLSNGLCQAQVDGSRKSNIFWRNGCTDSLWNAPECLRQCPYSGNLVFYCLKSETWCCNDNAESLIQAVNTTGCSICNLVFQASDPVVYTVAALPDFVSTATKTPISSTQTPSRTTTTLSISSGTSGTAAASSDSSESKIGIYVGVPLGIVIAIALAIIAWLLLRQRKKSLLNHNATDNAGAQETYNASPSELGKERSPVYARQELPSPHEPPTELPGNTARY